jgi:L-serine kinase (ADP)
MLIQASKDLAIDLRIVRLDELIPHEHTIPSLLQSVTRDLERTGLQRDPILVDSKTDLVLDGMHRRAALEAANCRFALCAAYDYLADGTKLQRWLRYFIAPDRQFIEATIKLFDFERVENIQIAMQKVDSKENSVALLSNRESYVSKEHYDLTSVYHAVADFDVFASESGISMEYHSDSDNGDLFLSESVFVVYPLLFSKQDIIQAAESGRLLPHKTTRHIVPIRPMGIYFPIQLLSNGSKEQCGEKLREIVEKSRIDVIEANSWYEGRKYAEPLALFDRER